MQRSKTATDLGAHTQAARAATLAAIVGKRRSSKRHPSAKQNNSQPTPQPIVTSSTASHPTLVVDRRAARLASLAKIARAKVTGPSGARQPSATRRTAARPSHPQTIGKPTLYKSATPPLKSSLKDGKGSKVKFVKSQRLVGKVHCVQTKTLNTGNCCPVVTPTGKKST